MRRYFFVHLVDVAAFELARMLAVGVHDEQVTAGARAAEMLCQERELRS